MNQEEYNKETERLQQLIDYKTKEAQSAPSYAQKQILDEVDKLKLQLQVHADNPPKKPEEPRAQGLLQSVKSAEKASAGITPPVSNTEEVQVDEKNIGVLQPERYEPKRYAKEKRDAKRNQIKDVTNENMNINGDFDIGSSTENSDFKGGSTETGSETSTTETEKKEKSKPEDTPKKDDKKYKSSMYGILDAMRNGDIDKSTGIYFMLDALSKAARNTGIDIGNIGAQFTGGTVRNDYQDSLWNQRKDKMFANEISSELNKQEGTDKEMAYSLAKEDLIGKGLSNEQASLMLDASRKLKDNANKFRAEGNETLAGLYDVISSGAASGKIDVEEIAGIVAAGVLDTPEGKAASKEIIELLSTLGQTVNTTLGSVNNAASSFSNGVNQVMSLFTGNK